MKKKKIVLVVVIIIILCVLGVGYVARNIIWKKRANFNDYIIDAGVGGYIFKNGNLIDDWEYNAQESASNYRGASYKSYGRDY